MRWVEKKGPSIPLFCTAAVVGANSISVGAFYLDVENKDGTNDGIRRKG